MMSLYTFIARQVLTNRYHYCRRAVKFHSKRFAQKIYQNVGGKKVSIISNNISKKIVY